MNNRELKYKVLYHYSNGTMACTCCGENFSVKFLTIDHIYNDGNIHRKELKETGQNGNFYRYLINSKFPDAYQVLCWNCNLGKSLNGGICPHQATDISFLQKSREIKELFPPGFDEIPCDKSLSTYDIWHKYTRNYGYTFSQTKQLLLDMSSKQLFNKKPKKGGFIWTRNSDVVYWRLTR